MALPTPASIFPAPDADYPVRPAGPLTRVDRFWLLGLLVLAFLPRAIVAARLGTICDDGYFYLAVADAYDRGDFPAALHYLNVNVYPVLLAAFGRLGFDTMTAAKWWGVAAGSLVVLPLFCWLRRMVDRRVAAAACCIYALHTEFIELSPEPIRDATFWLFCVCGFHFAWRAATERTLRDFVFAGAALALASHTRTEGWLLLLPAVAWPLARWRDAAGRRLRVVVGMAACLAVTPLFVLAFNLSVLSGHDRWELGRLEHLRTLTGTAAPPRPAAATVPTVTAAPPLVPTPTALPTATAAAPMAAARELPKPVPAEVESESHARTYLDTLGHTLEPVPLLLMLIGAACCRRVLVRPEHLVLTACCVAVLAAVWFRLEKVGEINGRYFLLCYFPAAGAAGIGLLATLNTLERRWPAFLRLPRPAFAAATAAALVGAVQAGDAIAATHPSRDAEGRLGEAIAERYGAGQTVLVIPRACRVGYFAAGRMPEVMLDVIGIEKHVDRHLPDLVIIENRDTPRAEFEELYTRLVRYGLRPCDITGMPENDRFVVLTTNVNPSGRPLGLARRDGR